MSSTRSLWGFIILLLLLAQQSFASHYQSYSSHISYQPLGNGLYEITLISFNPCFNNSYLPATKTVVITPGGTCTTAGQLVISYIRSEPLQTTCSALPYCSLNGPAADIQRNIYRGTVDLSYLANCPWSLQEIHCCRHNDTRPNMDRRATNSEFIESGLLDGSITNNHSPVLVGAPTFRVCDSTFQNISNLMYDPDGDSLTYELRGPRTRRSLTGPISNQPYGAGFSANNPIRTTNNNFFLNPSDGTFQFIPDDVQGTRVDVLIREYRNGQLIGFTRRATSIIVINCGTDARATRLDQASQLQGTSYQSQGTSTTFAIAVGQTAQLRLEFVDSNVTDSLHWLPWASSLGNIFPSATINTYHVGGNHQLTVELTIPNAQVGDFTLTVGNDACPMMERQTFAIRLVDGSTCRQVTGRLFSDWNTNCTLDATEPSFAGYVIQFTKGPEQVLAFSDAIGQYTACLDTGTYQIQVFSNSYVLDLCSVSEQLTIAMGTVLATHDLPVQSMSPCVRMEVQIGAPTLLHCRTNRYTVQYCNNGAREATGVYIDVRLDPLFSSLIATIPIDSQGYRFLRFYIDTVAPGTCASFDIFGVLDLNCDPNKVGQVYCADAHIYPDTTCVPWVGPFLEMEGECLGDSVRFRVVNTGNQPMTVPHNYTVYHGSMMATSMASVQLAAGAASPWRTYYASGAVYRAEIPQAAGHPWSTQASSTILRCMDPALAGRALPSSSIVNAFSLNDQAPFHSTDCQISVAACDPNQKEGFPNGYGAQHYIEKNTSIEYRIQFQNTGTYFATDVVLRDTISPHFVPSSIRVGGASHAYTWRLIDQNVLEVTFANIMLPDSGSNYLQSIGFIDIRLDQQPNLPLGTVLNNQVAIYFDLLPPIFTNTTFHTIGENFVQVIGTPTLDGSEFPVQVRAFPNPFQGQTTLHVEGPMTYPDLRLEVYNATGQLVQQIHNQGNAQAITLSRQQLTSGLYFYRLLSKDQLLHTGKLMAQ